MTDPVNTELTQTQKPMKSKRINEKHQTQLQGHLKNLDKLIGCDDEKNSSFDRNSMKMRLSSNGSTNLANLSNSKNLSNLEQNPIKKKDTQYLWNDPSEEDQRNRLSHETPNLY